jgi:hypothetical protein
MVNGSDHDAEIAAYAKKFETILLKSKPRRERPWSDHLPCRAWLLWEPSYWL